MVSEQEMLTRLKAYVAKMSFADAVAKRMSQERYGVRTGMSKMLWRKVIEDGYLVPAYVIDTGGSFVNDRTDLPALVLITFDRQRKYDTEFMTGLVRRLKELARSGGGDPEAVEAARLLGSTMDWMVRSRRPVPKSLTDGVPVYVTNVILDRAYLKYREVRPNEELVCMASPASNGLIAHIPWWIVEGAEEEKRDVSSGLDFRVVFVVLIAFLLILGLLIYTHFPASADGTGP